jgi:C4-dicarboxylate-specific signal transduction histidine kinase
VAHELNTPLGTIVGYAQLLNEGGTNEARRLEYTKLIYSEAQRCSRIIENLRMVARRDVCRPETCNIDSIIGEVVDTVCNCPSRSHNARIETRLASDVVVEGGAGQLDIVLVNVIMNAVQAASNATADPLVTVSSTVHGSNVVISVTDNGPGIAAAERHHVFDPFFTTKHDKQGIGLGLAISQSIVTRIGGTLRCDADYQNGARFLLTLPLAERLKT